MKIFSKLIFITSVLLIASCTQEQGPHAAKLKLDQVYQSLSPVMCKKISSCGTLADKENNLQQCTVEMQNTLNKLKTSAGNVEMEVTQEGLDKCLQTIEATPCESFLQSLQSRPPQNCEFLEAKLAS
jgi:hypothetical protein